MSKHRIKSDIILQKRLHHIMGFLTIKISDFPGNYLYLRVISKRFIESNSSFMSSLGTWNALNFDYSSFSAQ